MAENPELSRLMELFLDFGETMMAAGAEIARVEDSLARMGVSYGAVKTNVFVITSSIELTITFDDGASLTRTRRIRTSGGTDFVKLQKLNALSRLCAADRLPLEELDRQLEQIRLARMSRQKYYMGSVLAAGAFSVFFGGSMTDALVAGAFAVLICLMQEKLAGLSPNKVFFLFICSLITGVGICLVDRVIPGLQIDKIIIGDIMLLIPGVAITNAVRDTLIGDTISGITKLADSLVWAAALAAGFMIAIHMFAG